MRARFSLRNSVWLHALVIVISAGLLLGITTRAPLADDRQNHDGTSAFIKLVTGARLIDLSHTWDKNSPIASVNPTYSFELVATHENTRGTFNDNNQLSFTAEVMHWSGQHGAPSIDAIGHIGRDGLLFGGVDAAASTSNPDGIGASGVGAQLAIDRFPNDLLVTRGVLLDVAKMIQGDSRPLPPDFEVTSEHLKAAAKRQQVQLRRG